MQSTNNKGNSALLIVVGIVSIIAFLYAIYLLLSMVLFTKPIAEFPNNQIGTQSKICSEITLNNNKAYWSKTPCKVTETEQTIISDAVQHPGEYCCAISS